MLLQLVTAWQHAAKCLAAQVMHAMLCPAASDCHLQFAVVTVHVSPCQAATLGPR